MKKINTISYNGNNKKLKWAYIIFIVLILLIFILSFYAVNQMKSNQLSQFKDRLNEVVVQNSEQLKNMINDQEELVEKLAISLSKIENLNSNETWENIEKVGEISKLTSISIDFLNGSSFPNKSNIGVLDYNYLEIDDHGKTYITEPLHTETTGVLKVYIISPITKEGVIIGAVRGTITNESMLQHFNTEFFGGEAEFLLLDSEDKVISQTEENLLSRMDGGSYYIESMVVGIKNWKLSAIVPKKIIAQDAKFISYSTSFIAVIISLVFIVFSLFIKWKTKRFKNEVTNSSKQNTADEKKLQFMIGRMGNTIFEFDINTGQIDYSENLEKVYMAEPQEGSTYSIIENNEIHKKDEAVLVKLFNDIKEGKEYAEGEFRIKNFERSYSWCFIVAIIICDNNNMPIKGFGFIENINEKKEIENKYNVVQAYKNVLENHEISMLEVNLTQDKYIKGYEDLLEINRMGKNYSYTEIQKELSENLVYFDDKEVFNQKTELSNLICDYRKGVVEQNFDFRIKVGKVKYAWAKFNYKVYVNPNSKEMLAIIYIININPQKSIKMEMTKKARQDELTRLYNKMNAENLMKEYLSSYVNSDCLCALFVIDINNIKALNVVLGQRVDDLLLIEIFCKLKLIFRSTDVLGRWGDNEFIVFMKNCESVSNAEEKAKAIADAFYINYKKDGRRLSISANVGISICPDDGITFEELYNRAEKAMHISKESGKNIL